MEAQPSRRRARARIGQAVRAGAAWRLRRAQLPIGGVAAANATPLLRPARPLAQPGPARRVHARPFLPAVRGRERGVQRLPPLRCQAPARGRPPQRRPPPTRGADRSGVIPPRQRCATPMPPRLTVRLLTLRRAMPPRVLAPSTVTTQPRLSAVAGADPRRPTRLRRHALSVVVLAEDHPFTHLGAAFAGDRSVAAAAFTVAVAEEVTAAAAGAEWEKPIGTTWSLPAPRVCGIEPA
jgi:hypothetical protein